MQCIFSKDDLDLSMGFLLKKKKKKKKERKKKKENKKKVLTMQLIGQYNHVIAFNWKI